MINAAFLVATSSPNGPWAAIGAAILLCSVGVALWIYAPTMRDQALRSKQRSSGWVAKLAPEPATVGMIRCGAVVCLLMGFFCLLVAVFGE
jgi:ABC-type Fe3+ transport system permease subunit